MEFILNLTISSITQVLTSLLHNWPYLAISVVIAALLKLYVDAEKVSAFISRFRGASVVAATTAAVATPLCSCGTTAVILGMMASSMSWAPIVAFMVASPLTSPEGLVYSAGLFGWPFAWAFYLASIVLGLAGGWIATVLESRGWLANQTRFTGTAAPAACACSPNNEASARDTHMFGLDIPAVSLNSAESACGCTSAPVEPSSNCGCGPIIEQPDKPQKPTVTLTMFMTELYKGGKQLFVMFLGFAFIGYFLNGFIPTEWVAAIFGSGNLFNVPLAATLGLPLYINSEASLPLVRALMDNGMSQGAALAFLISGSGTSIGAITGALTIARWRVVGLVVAILWVGAIVSGFAFNLLAPLF